MQSCYWSMLPLKMLRTSLLLFTGICFVGAWNECPPECESKCNSVTDPCDKKPIDVVFLVDGSESITRSDFNLSLQWVLSTIKKLKPGEREGGLQVSLVQFSSTYETHLQEDLTDDFTSQFENRVLNINKLSSGTDTYGALNYVNTVVFPETRSKTFKFLITLTDGDPENRDDINVDQVIANAQQNFNVMLAVGVGNKIGQDVLRRLTHNAEPIDVVDFATLQDDIIFDRILNSTRKDCIRICACCNTSSKTSLTVDYCIRNVSGPTVDPSIIDTFTIKLSGDNGLTRTITNPADTCSAEFQGLNPYTEYDINVDAELTTPDITVRSDNVTCCTKGCIEIIPKCENSTETSLNISYELKLNGSFLVSEYIKEFEITISPPGSGINLLRKSINERTAGFGGLTNGTKYTITITPIFLNEAEGKKKIEAKSASINCSTSNCPLCLPKPLNVVFLIDGSESISREDFASSVAWASNLVNIFRKLDDAYEYPTPAERREMRITVVQYSDDAALESDVNRKIDPSSIPFSISISRQMRQGTQPYRGLRFVNNNVALNKTFFNVLVAFNDGHTPNEPEDMDAVNTAKNNYDKILAVGLGDEFDFTQGFLKNIAHHTDPFHMNQTKPFENITECVKNESHEDCIIFHAWCDCSETRTEVLLQYNYTLLGSLKNAADLISEYIITMDGSERREALDTKSAWFHQSTGWPLSPYTVYHLGIKGQKIPYKIGAIVPASVNCTTRALIRPTVQCSALSLTSVAVSIDIDDGGFRGDYSVIEHYSVGISPLGATPNPQRVNVDEQPQPFTGLAASTSYTITVNANKAEDVCGSNESDSVVCTTNDDICVKQPIDLVFLVDGSESVKIDLFKDGLAWTSNTADRFNQKDRDETLRVVAVQYSDISQEEFDVVMETDGTLDVTGVTQIRSATKTYSGLRFISNNVTPRTDSCKVLVTVSDGDSTEPTDQSAIDSVRNEYDVMIAAGYDPIEHEASLQQLSTVGKPITLQDTTSLSAIVDKTLETCCRKELKQRVNIVVFCEASTNTIEVRYHPNPVRLGKDSSQIQNYRVMISGGGQEMTSSDKPVTETTASFTGLKASTSYTIEVTGQPVDGTKVEVVTAVLSCMTKDPCSPSPCQNEGICNGEVDGGYKCDCPPGWKGTNCETIDDLIKPVVECVFKTDSVIVVAFKVNPTERGYDSSLIDTYSVAISPSETGTTTPIIKPVGDLTAVFTGLAQSTEYTVTVNINKASGANINVQEGSATCTTEAMVLPTQTNAPTDSGIVSTRTDPPLIIETTPSLMTESNPTASIGGSTSSSGNNGGNGNTSTGDGGNDPTSGGPLSSSPTALPSSSQPEDQCRTPIIVLAVLLVIAVIVALAFGIAFVRKGRRGYDVSQGTTD